MVSLPELPEFEGKWLLSRSIHDQQASANGTLEGTAEFRRQAGSKFLYEEKGVLSLGNQQAIAAERRYVWEEHFDHFDVFFEDGRFFHRVDRQRLMPEANHLCEEDMYHVTYDFTLWPRWTANWHVWGPKKDYRMTSEYRRQV